MGLSYTKGVVEQGYEANAATTGLRFAKIVALTGQTGANKQAGVENNDSDGGFVKFINVEDTDKGNRAGVYDIPLSEKVPIEAGVALPIGAEVASNASGQGKVAVSNNWVAGIVVQSAAAGGVAVITPAGYYKA